MEYYSGSKFALEGIADSLRYSLSAFNISVTNVNPGPVRTKFTDVFGVHEAGGRGSRVVPGEDAPGESGINSKNYINSLTQAVIDSLNRRMLSAEGQDSEAVAVVIAHLSIMRLNSRRIEDIPFNIGTSATSQAVLEAVKKQPTGWGGMYANLLKSVPPLPPSYDARSSFAAAGRAEL